MYLGLDLGTSGLRVLVTDGDGAVRASATAHYDVSHPRPGWSEQDPARWVAALDGAIAELRAGGQDFAGLRGIAVAGHMHGAVLLDEHGDVLRPCILWNDTRAARQAARLDADAEVRRLSGNIIFPGFTAPKLVWVAEHEPDVFDRVARVLLPAAYLNFHLTGEAVGDMSDAAGTAWLDVGERRWSQRLLDRGGMREAQMPRLVEGAEKAGQLRTELARAWGATGPVTVAGGAGDNAAAACGTGCLSTGTGFVSLGTSGVVLAARDGFAPDPPSAVHTFCHAVPGQWYQMGVMLSATDCLNWLGRMVGRTPAELSGDVEGPLPPPGPELFLPYLSGERTPHNDTVARAQFRGLGIGMTPEDLTRAVMTGVAYGLADCAGALRSTGASLDACLVIGGGARSAYWTRLLATVMNTTLRVPADGEFGAALGAARLARVAADGVAVDEVMTPPPIATEVEPDRDLVAAYEDGLERFRAAYAQGAV